LLEPDASGSGVLFPASVKGVLLDETEVVLLENERGEWELPGGKLEIGERRDRLLEAIILADVRSGSCLFTCPCTGRPNF
jgi:hypothetical protein